MGVSGLLSRLKAIASERVNFIDGVGTVIYDGHASMHRAASHGSVAKKFALEGDVRALAMEMLVETRRFEAAGWHVVVVFDGATPPSKARTSKSRSSDRDTALAACRLLQAQSPINEQELSKRARGAVEFTSTAVAQVSQILKHSLRADILTAPYEADSQLKIMEDVYSREGERCLVRANDADLVVLGVRSLLWDVKVEQGCLVGRCIQQTKFLHPEGGVYSDSSMAFDFLRQLHAVNREEGPAEWSRVEGYVMARLRNYACVVGNDYANIAGIGPMRGLDIAIPDGRILSLVEIVENVAEATNRRMTAEVLLPQLKASVDMFCHPIVWDPLTGAHRHLSGVESSAYITINTGA